MSFDRQRELSKRPSIKTSRGFIILVIAVFFLALLFTFSVKSIEADAPCDCNVCHGDPHGPGWTGCSACHDSPPQTASHLKHYESSINHQRNWAFCLNN